MKTWKLKPTETTVDFRAAAEKPKENYSIQQTRHVVTRRNIKAGGELLVDYGIKYWFGQYTINNLSKNRIRCRAEKTGCMKSMIATEM